MKNCSGKMKFSVLALAVQSALLVMYAMPAHAEDDDVAALTLPTNFVEIGVSGVDKRSQKFGEYNGLNKSDGNVVGNFGVSGGNGYGGNEEGAGTLRWTVGGKDLGTTSRELNAAASSQGSWSINVGYDELRHNTASGYQTPYLGNMGGNRFVLPSSGFNTVSNTATMTPGQIAALHSVDVHNDRKNTILGGSYRFNEQWEVKLDYNHLDQSGAKLMAFGTAGINSATGETVSILPNPTNSSTDTVNLALNWVGSKAFASASYFGSFYRNSNNGVQFQTFAGANVMQTMSTAPSNDFHQLNLSGGYNFDTRTKLAGSFSYGRNTQNEGYAYDSAMMTAALPASSLGGVVVSTHASLKLTDQTTKDLALSAGVKYDKRDNQTDSYIYKFLAIDGSAHGEAYPNTPLSYDKTLYEVAADYRLNKNQKIRLAYDHEDINRNCNSYAVSASATVISTGNSQGTINFPPGTNCVVAKSSQEDKVGLSYTLKLNGDLSLNAGYSWADRRTDLDTKAIAAMVGTNGNVANSTNFNYSTGRTRSAAIYGINAGDFLGFSPYFLGSRTQQILKASTNWQATEKLSFTLGGRYTDDNYDSNYGVQKGNSWSLNLDANYAYSENGASFVYLTQQHRQRDLTDQQNGDWAIAAAASATALSRTAGVHTWTNKLSDEDLTLGLGFKQSRLFGGKFELAGDLSYSLGKTKYKTQLNYPSADSNGNTCSSGLYGTCGELPNIKAETTQIKLSGAYAIDKSSKIGLMYVYQHLSSNDFYYNAYQLGYTPASVMPTNQTSGNYSVNFAALTYMYTFR